MAISGHHSKVSLRNYIGRPSCEKIRACSDILSGALSGKSHQSLHRTILVCKLSQIVNFDGLTLLTVFVLYSQLDYLTLISSFQNVTPASLNTEAYTERRERNRLRYSLTTSMSVTLLLTVFFFDLGSLAA